MKLVVNDVKEGKSYQKEVDKDKEAQLLGKKIGDAIDGGIIGLEGYALQITGGTDKAGFPMTKRLHAGKRTKLLLRPGETGIRHLRKGLAVKKQVRGDSITQEVQQVNSKVTTFGAKALKDYGFVSTPKAEKDAKKAPKAKPKKK